MGSSSTRLNRGRAKWRYTDIDQFPVDRAIGIGPDGTVFVAANRENKVKRFSLDGTFLGQWGTPGSAPGQLNGCYSLTVDRAGNVYVLDRESRVQKFTSTGVLLTSWGSYGTGDGQFSGPSTDIEIGHTGYIYTLESGSGRIQKFGDASTPVRRGSWAALKQLFR